MKRVKKWKKCSVSWCYRWAGRRDGLCQTHHRNKNIRRYSDWDTRPIKKKSPIVRPKGKIARIPIAQIYVGEADFKLLQQYKEARGMSWYAAIVECVTTWAALRRQRGREI